MTTKNPAEQNVKAASPDGVMLSDTELKSARKEGAKEDAKEIGKDVHRYLTDGNLPGTGVETRWIGSDECQQYAFWLDRSVTDIKKAFKDGYIPDVKLYGLLALERNGQNRTEYVKFMVDTLDLDSDAAALPGGGPSYTNDTTAVTEL